MSLLSEIIKKKEAALPPDTNAYRVADGAPWDGIFIDALADRLLVSVRDTDVPRGLKQLLEESGRPTYLKRLDKDVKEVEITEKSVTVPFCIHGVPFSFDV